MGRVTKNMSTEDICSETLLVANKNVQHTLSLVHYKRFCIKFKNYKNSYILENSSTK